ncbi:MAG: hypothetical protein H6719_34755 [Sandaracinaceae bacterium]|nr:hypothetical protein [Sandaracinaceae bacterium]
MNVEEVAKHLKRVDKLVLASSEVPEEDLSVNITDLYNRYKWGGAGPTPLPGAALSRLDLVERTADARWMRHFDGNGRELGVYRTTVGYYWLLRFDPALKQHSLQHVGTAADIDQRYGSQG